MRIETHAVHSSKRSSASRSSMAASHAFSVVISPRIDPRTRFLLTCGTRLASFPAFTSASNSRSQASASNCANHSRNAASSSGERSVVGYFEYPLFLSDDYDEDIICEDRACDSSPSGIETTANRNRYCFAQCPHCVVFVRENRQRLRK